MLKATLLIASLAFASAVMAQYKWVDKNGRVQYGDTPPPGATASTIRGPAQPMSPPSEPNANESKKAPASLAEKDAEFRKRREDADKERDKQALARRDADTKRENCARAKENLRIVEAGRVARVDGKGERYYLDEAQLSSETARARQAVQEWCS